MAPGCLWLQTCVYTCNSGRVPNPPGTLVEALCTNVNGVGVWAPPTSTCVRGKPVCLSLIAQHAALKACAASTTLYNACGLQATPADMLSAQLTHIKRTLLVSAEGWC